MDLDLNDDEGEAFFLGFMDAAVAKIRYELDNAARAQSQEAVFCSIVRKVAFQK